MKHRIVWVSGGAAALFALLAVIGTIEAQRQPQPGGGAGGMGGGMGMGFGGPQVGRFVVVPLAGRPLRGGDGPAIVLLDTATGKLYRATEKDFLSASDLPKIGEGGMRFFQGGKGGPFGRKKEDDEDFKKDDFRKKEKEDFRKDDEGAKEKKRERKKKEKKDDDDL